MVSDTAKRPDEAAMRRILDRYSDSPEGIILSLAWLEGLSRKELNELTWNQVDFETQNLLLQDRTIPLEPSVAECLQKRYEQYSTISDRVIIADRGKKPMTLVNVSRLAKNALDSEGQDVALKDLRRDWIIRQIKAHGWAYAARVSGMAVSSLRGIFAAALWKGTAQTDDSQGGGDETEYILWRIVQQEGSSAAGLAIWMCWKLAMQPGEVVNLSWSQTDFIAGVLHLPDRDVPMGNRMRRLLKETWERQKDLPTDKVFVAPTTGNPMDQSRLSVVSRTAMIRGGLEGFSLRSLSAWANAKRLDDILIRGAEERGYLVRDTAAECHPANRLGVPDPPEPGRPAHESWHPLLSRRQRYPSRKSSGSSSDIPDRTRYRRPSSTGRTVGNYSLSGYPYFAGNGCTGRIGTGRKTLSLAPKGTGGKNINIYFLNKFLPDFPQKDTCIYASVTDFQNPFTGRK